jgi:hypothetical protein
MVEAWNSESRGSRKNMYRIKLKGSPWLTLHFTSNSSLGKHVPLLSI